MRTSWTFIALAIFAVPAVAQPKPKCGDLPSLPDDAETYLAVFSSPDRQWLRDAGGFDTISPESEVFQLTDERECNRVLVNLRKRIRDLLPNTPEGRMERREGYRYLIYRVGPYYVVPVHPLDEAGGLEASSEFVQVFRFDDLAFVGDFMH